MALVRAIIFAADELLNPSSPAASPDELADAVRAAARHHEVWVVGDPGFPLDVGALPAVRRAPSLHAVPLELIGARAGEGTVLVVGSRPETSARFANEHAMSAVVIAPEAGLSQPEDLEEAPDFILPAVGDVILLVRRMEREAGDFQGTE